MLNRIIMAALAVFLSGSAMAADDAPAAPDEKPAVCSKDGAPASDDYLKAAHNVMTLSKAADRMGMIIDSLMPTMIEMVRKSAPGMPDSVLADFKDALRDELKKSLPSLIDVEACVYVQHFSIDDLQQLAAFYQGPLGQKLLAENPSIATESMAIGMAWGERSGRAAMDRALARVKRAGDKT